MLPASATQLKPGFFRKPVAESCYCGLGGGGFCAGGVVAGAVLAGVAGFFTTGFFFATGFFGGSLSSTTVFFGGSTGIAACAVFKSARRRTISCSFDAAR